MTDYIPAEDYEAAIIQTERRLKQIQEEEIKLKRELRVFRQILASRKIRRKT